MLFLILFKKAARPLITVYSDKGIASESTITLPAVFKAPIRPDIVNFVHSEMRKNSRQPYAVSAGAGIEIFIWEIGNSYQYYILGEVKWWSTSRWSVFMTFVILKHW